MNKILLLIILTFVTSILWIASGFNNFSKEAYLSKKILDNSIPFDVKIDTEFLKNLRPANE